MKFEEIQLNMAKLQSEWDKYRADSSSESEQSDNEVTINKKHSHKRAHSQSPRRHKRHRSESNRHRSERRRRSPTRSPSRSPKRHRKEDGTNISQFPDAREFKDTVKNRSSSTRDDRNRERNGPFHCGSSSSASVGQILRVPGASKGELESQIR